MKKAGSFPIVSITIMLVLTFLITTCGDGNGPKTHSYRLALSGPTGRSVGALVVSLSDPAGVIKPDKVLQRFSSDGVPVWDLEAVGSPPSWRFVLLKKHGSFSYGDLFTIETTSSLNSTPTLVEVSDTDGRTLEVDQFVVSLVEGD